LAPPDAIRILDELINDGRNALSRVTGTMIGPGAVPLATAYVQWVERVEGQLRSLAIDPDLSAALQTERYWHVRQLHEEPISPYQLVQAEVDQQTSWLQELRDDVQRRLDRSTAAQGDPAVVDTNVLLEFEPPQSVDWPAVTGSNQVRLVVPLRVVEELDLLKYDRRRQDRAERARNVIRLLDGWLDSAGEPGQVRADTTIEVMVEPSPRVRPADADEEILGTCSELQQYVGPSVKLVTADMAMRLRAQGLGVPVVRMPERYQRQHAPRLPA
jgi:rRNA-processing protein FCF1